jgi:hypothetical protein
VRRLGLTEAKCGSRIILGAAHAARPVYTFNQFASDVYLPFRPRGSNRATAGTSEQTIKSHLIARFGKGSASFDRSGEVAGFSRPKCRGAVGYRSGTSAVVHARSVQAGDVRWAHAQQSGGGVENCKEMSADRAMRSLTEEEVHVTSRHSTPGEAHWRMLVSQFSSGWVPTRSWPFRWRSIEDGVIRVEERSFCTDRRFCLRLVSRMTTGDSVFLRDVSADGWRGRVFSWVRFAKISQVRFVKKENPTRARLSDPYSSDVRFTSSENNPVLAARFPCFQLLVGIVQ